MQMLDVDCLLVAESDPITGSLRRGPSMRATNPPEGVRYTVRRDRFRYPKQAAHYNLTPLGLGLGAVRLFSERLARQSATRNFGLVHAFFWNWERFTVPWIHENDQSLGQFLGEYVHIEGIVKKGITWWFASNLNSPKCRRVIVWSKWAKRGYVEDGVEESKITIIPPPFNPISDWRPHENCNVLFIGRDYHRKGGDTLLRAFEGLRDFADARLIYVGKIDDQEVLRRVKNDKRIMHYPNPSDAFLTREIFPVCDMFVLPTRADAFAISVVEAMSRAMPVVASNISALPEIVEDGVSGFLARPDDTDGFSGHIAKLIENRELRRRIGREAQKRVELNFSSKRIGAELEQVYASALAYSLKEQRSR